MIRLFAIAGAGLLVITHAAAGGTAGPPPVAIPEPLSLAMLAAGVGAAVVYRRFRR
jgi:hypothetical protein